MGNLRKNILNNEETKLARANYENAKKSQSYCQ